MEPEWSDFRVLLALASAGSVAGAARESQVDNSTVYHETARDTARDTARIRAVVDALSWKRA